MVTKYHFLSTFYLLNFLTVSFPIFWDGLQFKWQVIFTYRVALHMNFPKTHYQSMKRLLRTNFSEVLLIKFALWNWPQSNGVKNCLNLDIKHKKKGKNSEENINNCVDKVKTSYISQQLVCENASWSTGNEANSIAWSKHCEPFQSHRKLSKKSDIVLSHFFFCFQTAGCHYLGLYFILTRW